PPDLSRSPSGFLPLYTEVANQSGQGDSVANTSAFYNTPTYDTPTYDTPTPHTCSIHTPTSGLCRRARSPTCSHGLAAQNRPTCSHGLAAQNRPTSCLCTPADSSSDQSHPAGSVARSGRGEDGHPWRSLTRRAR